MKDFDKLAYRGHFPAINWLTSFSLYTDNLRDYFVKQYGKEWVGDVEKSMAILQEEAELEEIVRLVGLDALSPESRIVMETARAIREDFLHQNAFHEVDTYSSFKKMVKLMGLIMQWHDLAVAAQKARVLGSRHRRHAREGEDRPGEVHPRGQAGRAR